MDDISHQHEYERFDMASLVALITATMIRDRVPLMIAAVPLAVRDLYVTYAMPHPVRPSGLSRLWRVKPSISMTLPGTSGSLSVS